MHKFRQREPQKTISPQVANRLRRSLPKFVHAPAHIGMPPASNQTIASENPGRHGRPGFYLCQVMDSNQRSLRDGFTIRSLWPLGQPSAL